MHMQMPMYMHMHVHMHMHMHMYSRRVFGVVANLAGARFSLIFN